MLNRQDKRIARIKAAMWESRNIEILISKAIKTYKDPYADAMPKRDVTLYLGEDSQKAVTVKNVPHFIIGRGELRENLQLTATLEEIIEEEYRELPDEIDLDELLK